MSKKNKEINNDITKTGPLTYRELQQRNSMQKSLPMNGKDFMLHKISRQFSEEPMFNALRDAPTKIQSPLYNTGTSWGESTFDEGTATGDEFERIGDIRAENQPWYSKIANGVTKGALLAGTTFLDGTIGLATGAIDAIAEDDVSKLWDNPFTRAMNAFNEEAEKELPNYYTDYEQNAPWYNNIFTANWLGDKLIKNLGFTVGAIYSGGIYSKLLQGATRGAMGLAKFFNAGYNTIKNTKNTGNAISALVSSGLAATSEGSIEALTNSNDWYKLKETEAKDKYNQSVESLKDYYGEDSPEFKEAIVDLNKDYESTLARLNEDRAHMGNWDLLFNIPILTLSNIIQFGRLFANGFKTSKKAYNTFRRADGTLANGSMNYIVKGLLKGTKDAASEGTEEVLQKAASLSAGNYMSQDVNNFYKSKYDPQAEEESLDMLKAMSQGIAETLSDRNTWEEFTIGALTGALGIPRFRRMYDAEGNKQSPIIFDSGIGGEINQAYQDKKATDSFINKINEFESDPNKQALITELVRHTHNQKDMNNAAKEGNAYEFNNAEFRDFYSTVEAYDKTGQLNYLKDLITKASDISDEDVEDIVGITTAKALLSQKQQDLNNIESKVNTLTSDKESLVNEFNNLSNEEKIQKRGIDLISEIGEINDELYPLESKRISLNKEVENLSKEGKDIGPFVDENGNRKSAEDIKNKVKKNGEEQLKIIDEYLTNKNELEESYNGVLTDEQLTELAWIKSQISNWKDRRLGIFQKIEPQLNRIKGYLDRESSALAQSITEEGASNKGISERQKKLEGIKNFIDDISNALHSTKEGIANKVFKKYITKEGINSIITVAEDLFDEDEISQLKTDLMDTYKMSKGIDSFSEKLTEYLLNPTKIDEAHAKVDKQVAKEKQEKANKELIDNINKTTTFAELESIESTNELSEDTLNKSTNQLAKDYKKAKKFRAEVNDAIDSSEYSDEQKDYLKRVFNKRFSEEQSLNDLMNPELITEDDNFDDKFSSSELNPFLTIAADKVATSTPETSTITINSDGTVKVDSPTTGNDETATVPDKTSNITSNTLTELANQIVNEKDKSTILNLIKECSEIVKNAISTRDENTIDKANTSINELERALHNVNEYSMDVNFANKADSYIEIIYKSLPKVNPSISEEALLDSTINDPELKEQNKVSKNKQEDGKYNFYRSDLTEFQIDTFNDGTFIPLPDWTSADKKENKESYRELWKRISFNYVNEGKLKEGDKVVLKQERVGQYDTILMYHNDTVVGVLPRTNSYRGLKKIKEKLDKGEEVSLKVSRIMLGRFKFDKNKTQSIGSLLKDYKSTITFSVMATKNGHPELITNTKDVVERAYDEVHSDGRVYINLPNSRGTLSPKLVRVKHFNKEEFDLEKLKDTDNTRANELHNILTAIASVDAVKHPDDIDKIMSRLGRVLHVKGILHMNVVSMNNNSVLTLNSKLVGRKNIVLARGEGGYVWSSSDSKLKEVEATKENADKIYNEVLDYLYKLNPVFNVRASKVNTSVIARDKEGNPLKDEDGNTVMINYNDNLIKDDILYTHLTSTNMVGSWFITDWYDDEGNLHKAEIPKGEFNPTSKSDKKGTNIVVGGKQYYVNNNKVYDVHENLVTGNTQLIKDLARCQDVYGSRANGVNMDNNKVLLSDTTGLDRTSQRYLTKSEVEKLKETLGLRKSNIEKMNSTLSQLNKDQYKVKRDSNGRPDTSLNENGESVYRILEDDGKYHEYKRIHTLIGSNWLNSNSSFISKNGEDALKWGNLVDDICREYFSGNETPTKPEDMTDQAYNSLLKKLKEYKSKLEDLGEEFMVNRVVIFTKLPDGTRVAGELDALSKNPITGQFRIYDFKTSKNTFHARQSSNDKYNLVYNNNQIRSTKAQHTWQLSGYKNIFDASYDSTIEGLYIMPFVLNYDGQTSLKAVNGERLIPLTYDPSVPVNTGNIKMPHTTPATDNIGNIDTTEHIESGNDTPQNKAGQEEGNKQLEPYDKVWDELENLKVNEITIRPDGTINIDSGTSIEGISVIEGTGSKKIVNILFPELNNPNFIKEGETKIIETQGTSRSGKTRKGKYIVTKKDGFIKVKHEGSNITYRKLSKQELTDKGITQEDILGDRKGWSTLEDFKKMEEIQKKADLELQLKEETKDVEDKEKRIKELEDSIKKDKELSKTKEGKEKEDLLDNIEGNTIELSTLKDSLKLSKEALEDTKKQLDDLKNKKNNIGEDNKGPIIPPSRPEDKTLKNTYFELNGKKVSANTTKIGSIEGYDIRVYIEPKESKILNITTTSYNYYIVLPNGKTKEMMHEQALLTKEQYTDAIMPVLQAHSSEIKAMAEEETELGKANNNSLAEARARQNRLNATNIPTNRGNINTIGEEPTKLVKDDKPVSTSTWDKEWKDLSDRDVLALQAMGCNSTDWNRMSPIERESEYNCLGI